MISGSKCRPLNSAGRSNLMRRQAYQTTHRSFAIHPFSDTYQEANGLLFADREPKVPFDEIALATNGGEYRFDALENSHWRDRLMDSQR